MGKIYFIKARVLQYLNLWKDRFLKLFNFTKNHKKNNLESLDFTWRGLHLDVARHAVSIEYLYKLIDKLQELNLNKLHLHLTDDQGWRVEIKKYPKLHELGSKREETVVGKKFPTPWNLYAKYIGDGKVYQKFYTQSELKSLVKYAKEKEVEIIPEIDIPGHATAMLFAYPEYSAGIPPEKVATYWGVFPNVISDTHESMDFLKDIFSEICEIFESEYIHIGGDEVPLENYKNNPETPKKILKEIILFLNSKNKKVIVWDEAAELAIETGNISMVWRSVEEAKKILNKDGKIILCPHSHFYFDYYQKDPANEPIAIGGYLPLDVVYNFNVKEIFKKEGKYFKNILGVQANLWTEYLPTEKDVDYMLYPRIYALAEVANQKNTDFKNFSKNIS